MPASTYILPADAGIRDAVSLWAAIRSSLNEAEAELELDARDVTRPDTALAQMLAVAVARAREQGKSVRVVRASQRLRDLVTLLALNVLLGD